jgi:hypothetical protein
MAKTGSRQAKKKPKYAQHRRENCSFLFLISKKSSFPRILSKRGDKLIRKVININFKVKNLL